MPSRRDFYRIGSFVLGGLTSLGLSVPVVAYLLDPLRRKGGTESRQELTRLGELKVGVPRAFSIIAEKTDAWVKYEKEPVGIVWLIRQPEGAAQPVVAFTAECPHLGCPVSLKEDAKSFICHCHQATFDIQGHPTNAVPPRGMDTLDVELTPGDDPGVVVRFRRFRTQAKEKIPLV
jgi:menaquinol-cytochrome c reductase iron-sulfur subunit